MYNEKSKKNLKPFSSENQPEKRGRPMGSLSLTNEIKKVLESTDPTSQKLIFELLVTAAIKHAMKGNASFFREIIERVDGKIPDKIETDDKDKGPVIFRVVYENQKRNPEDSEQEKPPKEDEEE